MKRPSLLRSADVRQLLRIVAEARELATANCDMKPHVLEKLAELTRSDVAIEFHAHVEPGALIQVRSLHDYGWSNDADRARIYDYVLSQSPDTDALMAEAMRRPGPVVTLARAEVVSKRDWRKTELFNEIYVPSRVDSSMVSLLKVETDTRVLVFKRSLNRAAFGERERDLVDLFLSECGWLYCAPRATVDPRAKHLSPRERQVLHLLLTGAAEKQVAASIGVSRHTSHQYVKSIYRKLGVTSRAELMATAASFRQERNAS